VLRVPAGEVETAFHHQERRYHIATGDGYAGSAICSIAGESLSAILDCPAE
jgi:hypothetical protein